MRRITFLTILIAFGCGGPESAEPVKPLSREPVSVRGWIADVEGADRGEVQTPETEGARLQALFQATNVWVEEAAYVSGGVAETGAFILLDVPPGDADIVFNAPGAENATLTLRNIPGNADVLIPAILLKPGGATLLQPAAVVVRVPADVPQPRQTGRTATIAGVTVPVIAAPLSAFVDRREYPERGLRPIAVVK